MYGTKQASLTFWAHTLHVFEETKQLNLCLALTYILPPVLADVLCMLTIRLLNELASAYTLYYDVKQCAFLECCQRYCFVWCTNDCKGKLYVVFTGFALYWVFLLCCITYKEISIECKIVFQLKWHVSTFTKNTHIGFVNVHIFIALKSIQVYHELSLFKGQCVVEVGT